MHCMEYAGRDRIVLGIVLGIVVGIVLGIVVGIGLDYVSVIALAIGFSLFLE